MSSASERSARAAHAIGRAAALALLLACAAAASGARAAAAAAGSAATSMATVTPPPTATGPATAPAPATATATAIAPPAGELRVCADPNNLPFSNARGEGFENRIAEILARDLDAHLSYAWWPQRRGFVRNTLKAGRCDLVIGVPAHYELVATTEPYYRSTYVFVTRHDRDLSIHSFDDPRLRTLTIGVHMVGDDYANLPPARALTARHVIDNLRGYSIYGDYSQPDPPRRLIDAVAHGDIDVALAWGPLAGYFAQHEPAALDIAPVPARDAGVPMSFAIAMGVRHGDATWLARVQQAIERRRPEIEAVLRDYGVPLLPIGAAGGAAATKE